MAKRATKEPILDSKRESTVTITISLADAMRIGLFAFLKEAGYDPWPKAIGEA